MKDKITVPLFATHIPKSAAIKVYKLIRSGWINRGEKAEEFEDAFKSKFGYPFALSVNSCTSALRMAYSIAQDLYWPSKKEVITTPYTMVATNTAILECGLRPKFADVQYGTGNINPESVKSLINSKTLAIVGVDYAGFPCDWSELREIADEADVMLIDDAAQSLGAKIHGYSIGKYCQMACFSFQAIKHITTGDGGMFVCKDETIYSRAREKIWFGMDKAKRVQSPLGPYPQNIINLGFKYGMNDIAAVMGIEGLKDFDQVSIRRREIAKRYREELSDVEGLTLMEYDDPIKVHANWMFPIHVKRRLKFAKLMRGKGIEVAVHNWNNARYSIFGGDVFADERLWVRVLPQTTRLNNDVTHIPLHAELTDEQVNYVIKTIRKLRWI